jgi:hypothetical protein
MSYSVQTVSKRELLENANGKSLDAAMSDMLNRLGVEIVAVTVGEQSVTVVLHHTAKAKPEK